jgi:hypothetical protein
MPASVLRAPGPGASSQPASYGRLVVAWQNPDPGSRMIEPIGLLAYDDRLFRFSYIRHSVGLPGFEPLLGFEDMSRLYKSETLFPVFAQRAMNRRRPEFAQYVEELGFTEDPEPWELIGRTQGMRRGDTLQLLPVPDASEGDDITYPFLVNGIRHLHEEPLFPEGRETHVSSEEVQAALNSLEEGAELTLVPEPLNPVNPRAILVADSTATPVGWVPNLLAEDVNTLMESGAPLRVTVRKVNPDAPWHMRLLAQLHLRIPAGFRFFAGEGWTPIADGFPQ